MSALLAARVIQHPSAREIIFSQGVPQVTALDKRPTATFQILKGLELTKASLVPKITAKADNLLILGDISDAYLPQYQEITQLASKRFGRVFVVAGRQEYRGNDPAEVDCFLQKMAYHYTNVTFLQKQSFLLRPDLVIAGSTLRLPGCLDAYYHQNLSHAFSCQHPYRKTLYACYGQPQAHHKKMFAAGLSFICRSDNHKNEDVITM